MADHFTRRYGKRRGAQIRHILLFSGQQSEPAVPSWVMRADGVPATMDLDFVNDRAWLGGVVTDIATVLAAARLDAEGAEILAATPDDLVIDIGDITGFSETEGTVITHAIAAADAAANYALWGIDDGSADNRLCQFRNTSSQITGFAAIGGSADLAMTVSDATIGNGYALRTAMAWTEDDGAIVVNAGDPATDASGGIPTGATRFTIGRDHDTAYWNEHIRRLTYFNTRLPNSEMQAKTARLAPDAEIVLSQTTFPEDDGPLLATISVINGIGTYAHEIYSDPDNLFAIDGDDFETDTELDFETIPNPEVGIRSNNRIDPPIEQVFEITVTNVIEIPDAFVLADWDLTAGDTEADVTINSLPADNGAAITDVEYRLDGGSWVSSGGTTSFTITGLTNGVEYDVELRAVNADGVSAAGDLKSVTPEAVGGTDGILLETGDALLLETAAPVELNTGIPALAAADPLDGSEMTALVQSAATVKLDLATLAEFING